MRPKKSLGQNFLHDDSIIQRIVDSVSLSSGEIVIEIGPGRGALTDKLLESGANVVAIEIDRILVPALRTQFHFQPNFEVFEADVLEVDFLSVIEESKFELSGAITEVSELGSSFGKLSSDGNKAKLVANLPYNISTPILQRLADQRHIFSSIVLMFQREVVERITARPGGKNRCFLSVIVEDAFQTEYLFDIAPTAFHPIPKVWSSVVRLTPKKSEVSDGVVFRRLISSSFAQKRKTLLNNLKHAYNEPAALLTAAGIDGRRRAETLTIHEWISLANQIEHITSGHSNATTTEDLC